MLDWIRPSIDDGFPPVTRPITLLIVAGPLNAALSPVARPNCRKLWKRLLPTCLPRLAVIA